MQPGGKLQPAEAPLEALGREMREELTCSFSPSDTVFLGTFTGPAANEEGFLVEAALYRVQIVGQIRPAAEIEEVLWLHPQPPHSIALAPLTRERVLPLAQTLGDSW
jgi:8-oxo-dGTP diphosphatase